MKWENNSNSKLTGEIPSHWLLRIQLVFEKCLSYSLDVGAKIWTSYTCLQPRSSSDWHRNVTSTNEKFLPPKTFLESSLTQWSYKMKFLIIFQSPSLAQAKLWQWQTQKMDIEKCWILASGTQMWLKKSMIRELSNSQNSKVFSAVTSPLLTDAFQAAFSMSWHDDSH